jgi:hypothetical protein
MRLESVFIQVRARDISKNHASRALRCFKKNHACCHWSQKADTNVSFTLRTSAKKGRLGRRQNTARSLKVPWRWARVFRKSIRVYPPGSRICIFARALKDSSVICSQKKAKAASTFTVRTGLKSHWASTKPAYCCACGRVDGQLRPVRSNPNQTHQRSLAASC